MTMNHFRCTQNRASMFALIQFVVFLVFPVLFVLGDAKESPFLFTGILQFGCGIGAFTITLIFKFYDKAKEGLLATGDVIQLGEEITHTKAKQALFTSEVKREIWSFSTIILMMVSVIGNCMLVLFALGLLFVNASTAVLLFETRYLLLFFVLALPFMSTIQRTRVEPQNESRDHRAERLLRLQHEARLHQRSLFFRTLIFCVPAVAGVVLVIMSHNDTPHPLLAIGGVFVNPGTLLGGTLFGVFFVLMATISYAFQRICAMKIAERVCHKHANREGAMAYEKETKYLERCMTSISLVIAGVSLCAIGLAIDLIASETISFSVETPSFSGHQLFYTMMGTLAYTIGTVAKEVPRRYLIRADAVNKHNREEGKIEALDLGVKLVYAAQTFRFATPLGILILLWMLSILEVLHLDYLIIGAMGITVSNLLIRDETFERISYQALMVSFWLFGTITYFVDGFETDVPLELPVTVFILVLVFRVSRLVRRTADEEKWVLEVFHRLSLLASKELDTKLRGFINAAKQELTAIDEHKSVGELITSYKTMVQYLVLVGEGISKSHRDVDEKRDALDKITDIRRLVDMLVHSRQQGSRFDEMVAVALTGGVIVLGLLVFNGDNKFYSEFSSFLLSSVVVFLFFNILDLEKDRKDKTMTIDEEMTKKLTTKMSIVNFEGAKKRDREGASTVLKSIVIVTGFLLLFAGVFR